ncbi:MAG: hypothetical protein WC378_14675 [Opitutaceae bacterium]|jgi:hypothetical protein
MTPLSNEQKAKIGQAARQAYLAWSDRLPFELINAELSASACFASWRHVEQGKACGVQSLRACTQAHYGRLLAHFQAIAGNVAGADRTRARDGDNDRRIARYKLAEALRERDLGEAYAASICRRQYRCALDEASAKQVWHLVYTVRNRRKALATVLQTREPDPF